MHGMLLLLLGAIMMVEPHGALRAPAMPPDGAGATEAITVRVLAWNVFDLPEFVFPVASHARMERLVPALSQASAIALQQVDALVLTELYSAADRRSILRDLAELGFQHHVGLTHRSVFDAWRMLGVVVVSRWPIERWASMPFVNACSGLDCFASKGCVYARLLKATASGTQVVNLFAAHFYLGKTGAMAAARQRQALAMQRFMRAQAPSGDEMTLVAGDFNAPWHIDGPGVLKTLGAYHARRFGTLDHTFVGEGHVLSGSPRRAVAERARTATNAAPANQQAGRKWIDYVAAAAPGRAPAASELTAIDLRGAPYSLGEVNGTPLMTDALSDHHAVLGTFRFLGLEKARAAQ